MLRQINIQLIDKIRKPVEGNRFLNSLLSVLIALLYPIIIIVGVFLTIFIAIIAMVQNLQITKGEKDALKTSLIESEGKWAIFLKTESLTIYQKYVGEVRFGPVYLKLKSEPEIPGLIDKLFGDWFFSYKEGVLLQEWNRTDVPNTNLLYTNKENLKLQPLQVNIPSVLWDLKQTEKESLVLSCNTGREILVYKIETKGSSS